MWANEAGGNEAIALRRAEEKINAKLAKLEGEIVEVYSRMIAPPLLKRTYATLIVAVNGRAPLKIAQLPAEERRERLSAIIQMLGGDTRAINLSRLAKTFSVSRDVLYSDLRKLGLER
jgi:hypothetical protein